MGAVTLITQDKGHFPLEVVNKRFPFPLVVVKGWKVHKESFGLEKISKFIESNQHC